MGFVCDENMVYNEAGDGCILTQKACDELGDDYLLSEDGQTCLPKTGSMAPFAFILVAFFLGLLAFASWLKDRARSTFIANYIALLSILEPVMAIMLFVESIIQEAWPALAIFLIVMILGLVANILMFMFFVK